MQLAAFSDNSFTLGHSAMLVNEAAVRALGWDDPVGKRMREPGVPWNRQYTVVGVTDARHLYPPGTRLVVDGTTGD